MQRRGNWLPRKGSEMAHKMDICLEELTERDEDLMGYWV